MPTHFQSVKKCWKKRFFPKKCSQNIHEFVIHKHQEVESIKSKKTGSKEINWIREIKNQNTPKKSNTFEKNKILVKGQIIKI